MATCVICNHPEHDAGKCGRCNCGQSDVSHAQTKYQPHPIKEPAASTVGPTCDKGRRVPRRKTANS